VRRLTVVDLMLLGTVLLWALNVTVTKYVINHGFQPLAYATIRYLAATTLFWAFTYARERSFTIHLSDTKLVALAGTLIFVNQLCFVYGIKLTNASTMGLLLGTTPIFIGILATLLSLEVLGRRFWAGAVLSFLGVGLVASGNKAGTLVASGLVASGLVASGLVASGVTTTLALVASGLVASGVKISACVGSVGFIGLLGS